MAAPVVVHDVFPAVWPGVALAGLVVAAAFGPRYGRRGGLVIGLLSICWLVGNARAEGGLLLGFNRDHGLVVTDLAGLAGLGVAGWLLVRGRL